MSPLLPTSRTNALFERFPYLSLPYIQLGDYPTPVTEDRTLAEIAGVERFLIKRDDLTATPYGGNKVRRLEFFLAAARHRGVGRLLTVGALGSHHVLATAIYSKRLGFELEVRHFSQPQNHRALRNLLRTAGHEHVTLRLGAAVTLPLEILRQRLWAALRPKTFYIPGGGTSPLGALGYVAAALELDAQIARGDCPKPDAVVVPVGSGGTLAGLVVGFRLAGRRLPVIGVRVVDRLVVNRYWLGRLIRGTERLLRRHGVFVPKAGTSAPVSASFTIDHSEFGAGYGVTTAASERAVEVANEVGLSLEAIYSGKALAAALTQGRRWVGATGTLLFVHTASACESAPTQFGVTGLPARYRRALRGWDLPDRSLGG